MKGNRNTCYLIEQFNIENANFPLSGVLWKSFPNCIIIVMYYIFTVLPWQLTPNSVSNLCTNSYWETVLLLQETKYRSHNLSDIISKGG